MPKFKKTFKLAISADILWVFIVFAFLLSVFAVFVLSMKQIKDFFFALDASHAQGLERQASSTKELEDKKRQIRLLLDSAKRKRDIQDAASE